jgi:hypothetical protein
MEEFTPEQISALAAFVEPGRFSTGQSNRELPILQKNCVRSAAPPASNSVSRKKIA